MIEGSAVDVMVASSAVSSPANPMAIIIAQNLRPGPKGTIAAGGGLTADLSCIAGSSSEMDCLGSERGVDILPVGDGGPRFV